MTGFVYFIRCGDFVKIGYSRNPEQRMEKLKPFFPVPPIFQGKFPGTRAIETKLHRYLAHHMTNDEWFRWCPEIKNIIDNGPPDLSHIGPKTPKRFLQSSSAVQPAELWNMSETV